MHNSLNRPRFLLQHLLQEQPVSDSRQQGACVAFLSLLYDCAQFQFPSQSFSRNGKMP